MNADPSTPETICQQCGDRGFANAFVYCVKCLNFAVHRYCLDVIPATVNEFVRWACDDCNAQVLDQPALGKSDTIRCETGELTASEHILGNSDSGVKKTDTAALNIEKPVYDGGPCRLYDDGCAKLDLVRCAESASDCYPAGFRGMSDERVLSAADQIKKSEQSTSQRLAEKVDHNLICLDKLSADAFPKESMKTNRSPIMVSSVRNDQHRMGDNSSKRPHEKCTNIGISECAKLASDSTLYPEVKENKASEKRDRQLFSKQLCESDPRPGAGSTLSCDSSSRISKKKKTNMSSAANLEEQRHRALVAQHLKEHKRPDLETQGSGERSKNISNDHNNNGVSEASEDRTPASSSKRFQKDSTVPSMFDCTMLAQPLMEPIWRGSFNIRNKDILVGLMAHMSSVACREVHDEACQFQPVLHLEMLPKSNVWPKSFERSDPGGENVALYFFPSEIRSERVFDHLVDEMAHNELALRVKTRKADLLVFTSMELPLPYWRFQGKYYLWGVFREERRPQSSQSESRYDPIMRKDRPDNTGSSGGQMRATTKSFGGRSPLSPLSNCSSYGSGTS